MLTMSKKDDKNTNGYYFDWYYFDGYGMSSIGRGKHGLIPYARLQATSQILEGNGTLS